MKHTPLVHENCKKDDCPVCEQGLILCTVCGGFEGELPSECPGRKMTEQEKKYVYNDIMNFKDGKWINIQSGNL